MKTVPFYTLAALPGLHTPGKSYLLPEASPGFSSWHIDGEKMETVTDFIFMGSKITADGDCSHELKDSCTFKYENSS